MVRRIFLNFFYLVCLFNLPVLCYCIYKVIISSLPAKIAILVAILNILQVNIQMFPLFVLTIGAVMVIECCHFRWLLEALYYQAGRLPGNKSMRELNGVLLAEIDDYLKKWLTPEFWQKVSANWKPTNIYCLRLLLEDAGGKADYASTLQRKLIDWPIERIKKEFDKYYK